MFGFIRPYEADLSSEEKLRYRGLYCGLCRRLNDQYGLAGRMGLNYDMTFLILLLCSLYEPDETRTEAICPPHPLKKHPEIITKYTDYAADMTVVLAYYKALDDWQDERKSTGKLYAEMLKKAYLVVKERWPNVCKDIELCLSVIQEIEKIDHAQPEQAADYSGKMLACIFAVEDDYFQRHMGCLGYALGKFIYMMDAVVDYEHDLKKNCYNPLFHMSIKPEEAKEILQQPLGQAAEIFEKLPLVQDVNIMRNILYSGVWQQYNRQMQKRTGDGHGQ